MPVRVISLVSRTATRRPLIRASMPSARSQPVTEYGSPVIRNNSASVTGRSSSSPALAAMP